MRYACRGEAQQSAGPPAASPGSRRIRRPAYQTRESTPGAAGPPRRARRVVCSKYTSAGRAGRAASWTSRSAGKSTDLRLDNTLVVIITFPVSRQEGPSAIQTGRRDQRPPEPAQALESDPPHEERLLEEFERYRLAASPSTLACSRPHPSELHRERGVPAWRRILPPDRLKTALRRDVGLAWPCSTTCVNVNRELPTQVIEIAIYERTERSAVTDGLTGLSTTPTSSALKREVLRARRHDLKLSLAMFDLDDFSRSTTPAPPRRDAPHEDGRGDRESVREIDTAAVRGRGVRILLRDVAAGAHVVAPTASAGGSKRASAGGTPPGRRSPEVWRPTPKTPPALKTCCAARTNASTAPRPTARTASRWWQRAAGHLRCRGHPLLPARSTSARHGPRTSPRRPAREPAGAGARWGARHARHPAGGRGVDGAARVVREGGRRRATMAAAVRDRRPPGRGVRRSSQRAAPRRRRSVLSWGYSRRTPRTPPGLLPYTLGA